jgi:RsiW-degrading membrane proteinase PrsW (M82 family)
MGDVIHASRITFPAWGTGGNQMIEYLILAFAPGIFWLWFFWRKDTYDRERSGCS